MAAESILPPLGHNHPPDPIEILRGELSETHVPLRERGDALTEMGDRLPESCDDDETAAKLADAIKSCTAFVKNADAARVAAKEPHLAAGRAVDGFFKAMSDPVDKVKARMGALLTTYQRKVADAERRRLEAIAAEERKAAQEAERAAREAARVAREAREAEERRAREAAEAAAKLEGEARRKAEAEEAARRDAERARLREIEEAEAAKARDAARAAKADADKAREESQAKAADLSRSRTDLGSVASLRTTWVHEVENADEVPRAYLSVNEGAIKAAIKAATTKDGRCPLRIPGVRIYAKAETVVR
jgi:hypothetical protein